MNEPRASSNIPRNKNNNKGPSNTVDGAYNLSDRAQNKKKMLVLEWRKENNTERMLVDIDKQKHVSIKRSSKSCMTYIDL